MTTPRGAILAALLISATPATAQQIASTDSTEVCRIEMGINPRTGAYGPLSYSMRNRMPEAQSRAIKRAMLPAGHRLAEFELDHIVSLSIGGSNDKSNIQIQPIVEAKAKDELEVILWRSVCVSHTIPLAEAQTILMNDWRAGYIATFGREP